MVMGRGSDTRMYSPRSESDKMYSSANEDETKYNPASPEYNEQKRDEKKRKEEEKKERKSKIKHIKISSKQKLGGDESLDGLDDGNKRDDEREMGLQGGPAGSRGTLLDLATGAKSGTGSAMSPGLPIAMSEPMEDAWSSLLKEEPTVHPGENQYKHRYNMPNRDDVHPEWYDWIQETLDNPAEYEGLADDFQQPDINHLAGATSREEFFERLYDLHNFQVDDARPPFDDIEHEYRDFTNVPFNEKTGFTMSEPMEDAWSEILKRDTAKTIAARRRREARQQFRPSTGQFKTPPGGMSGGVGATKRRHAARMRGISSGKKTGLMKPHLSVEMSHRGIATKQPMSKDPQKYTAYRGQSEARKIQGNVRTPYSPRGRFGQRSFSAGPTGAGRLSGLLAGQRGQMTQPSLRQLGVRRPRIRRPRRPSMPSMPSMPAMQSSVPSMPAAPSSIMMSEDAQEYSELLKARNIARRYELLNLMRRLIQAKEKEAKKIKKYVQGGGSAFENGHVPDHPAGVQQHEDEDEKNDGPTQNLETNSSRLGLDPAGALISRRGHMG